MRKIVFLVLFALSACSSPRPVSQDEWDFCEAPEVSQEVSPDDFWFQIQSDNVFCSILSTNQSDFDPERPFREMTQVRLVAGDHSLSIEQGLYTLNGLKSCHRDHEVKSSNIEAATWSVERVERFEGDTVSGILTQPLADGRMLAMAFSGLDSDFRDGLALGRENTLEHKAPTLQMVMCDRNCNDDDAEVVIYESCGVTNGLEVRHEITWNNGRVVFEQRSADNFESNIAQVVAASGEIFGETFEQNDLFKLQTRPSYNWGGVRDMRVVFDQPMNDFCALSVRQAYYYEDGRERMLYLEPCDGTSAIEVVGIHQAEPTLVEE